MFIVSFTIDSAMKSTGESSTWNLQRHFEIKENAPSKIALPANLYLALIAIEQLHARSTESDRCHSKWVSSDNRQCCHIWKIEWLKCFQLKNISPLTSIWSPVIHSLTLNWRFVQPATWIAHSHTLIDRHARACYTFPYNLTSFPETRHLCCNTNGIRFKEMRYNCRYT